MPTAPLPRGRAHVRDRSGHRPRLARRLGDAGPDVLRPVVSVPPGSSDAPRRRRGRAATLAEVRRSPGFRYCRPGRLVLEAQAPASSYVLTFRLDPFGSGSSQLGPRAERAFQDGGARHRLLVIGTHGARLRAALAAEIPPIRQPGGRSVKPARSPDHLALSVAEHRVRRRPGSPESAVLRSQAGRWSSRRSRQTGLSARGGAPRSRLSAGRRSRTAASQGGALAASMPSGRHVSRRKVWA